ncbi:MAG TPA: hypothetical protein VKA31_11380 [Mariprofundaceae bacterium]|nr:hypothetical protein [Mariprofundaceae bacterium]
MTVENTEGAVTNTETKETTDQADGTTALTSKQPNPAANPDAVVEAEGTKPAAEQDAKGDKSEKVGAPEKYEDFQIPEELTVDGNRMDEFKPIAKELGLTQDQAQKLVDFYADGIKSQVEQTQSAWNDIMTTWQEDVKKDQEIGGKAFDESLSSAKKALDAFGTEKLYEALEQTGMGNHPEFIRVFSRMGKAIAEDKIRIGGASADGPKDPAHVLFPNQK